MCKKSTQFNTYEQQDAHELLRCLIEAVRVEELHRVKRAILKAFALNEKTDPCKASAGYVLRYKKNARGLSHTITELKLACLYGLLP